MDADLRERRAAATLIKEQQQSFFEALYASRDADAQEIVDGINLGAHAAAADKKAMQRRKISHVLICHPQLKEHHPTAFQYQRVPLLDNPESNLLELLPRALAFLGGARESGGKVFVCCAKGISRSSSVVIALLMVEKLLPFEEAFKICEQRRPIVYPNIGFQQQLHHLEKLLKDVDKDIPFSKRVEKLKQIVPRGSLSGPSSPLKIRDRISESMEEVLKQVEDLAEKATATPQLLQKRELWKRHGLYFENLHKYKALPSSVSLLDHARKASTTLKSLPKIFSESLNGIKLALAVAKELDGWAKFAEPVFKNPSLDPRGALEQIQSAISAAEVQRDDDEDPMKDFVTKPLDGKDAQDPKSKKDKKDKKAKKEAKAAKKAEKAKKKAEKALAKIEKAATKAEQIAENSKKRAELAAEKANLITKEIDQLEAEEKFEKSHSAAARRGGLESAAARRKRERTPSSGSSGDESSSKAKKRRR